MKSERQRASITGILFIAATAAAFIGDGFMGTRLQAPDFLAAIYADRSRVILSIIFKIIAAATSAGIAMSLYPVLRKRGEGLALGSVCFRLVEGVFYLVAALGLLSLVSLSQEYIKAEAALAQQIRGMGSLILAMGHWAGFTLGVVAFCLGASMYYVALFRTRLVPRWLSLWGLIALALLLTMVFLSMFSGTPRPSGMMLALAFPIALQEMVLAVWLIAKGFNPSAESPK